jgi:hypothetical protein
MGYEHIEHLYKHPEFFKCFSEAYALEKIHGTSTWIDFIKQKNDEEKESIDDFYLSFHSGGEKAESFIAIFDCEFLKQKLFQLVSENGWKSIRIHGEGYGGKQQGMTDTYGPILKFIAFDVKINGNNFLNIAESEKIAIELNLEFVHYEIGPCVPEWFDQQTKMHSIQAIKNGMGVGKLREGIIIRPCFGRGKPEGPLSESFNSANKRTIYKHKNPEFWEIASERPLGEKLVIMDNVYQIANEWITKQRMEHVLNHIISEREEKNIEFKDITIFVKRMIEDVQRESEGEVVWSAEVEKEIKSRSGLIFRTVYEPPKKLKQLIN